MSCNGRKQLTLFKQSLGGNTSGDIFASIWYIGWSDWCLYLLAWVQLFCLSTACTDSLSCQWVAFNACKMLCLRLTFMKYKQFMDCPNQFFKAPFCARVGREWYSTFSAILCRRRMASTWQILSSLHLLCDTTMVELSVHLYRQKGFTESLTKARATWSPVFKA